MDASFDIELFSRRTSFMRRRQYYFRCRDVVNGEKMITSEGYNNRDDRDDTVQLLKAGFASAQIVEVAK